MKNRSRMHISDFLIFFVDSVAEIEILAVHEEIRIEAAHLVQGFFSSEHERADESIYIIGLIFTAKGLIIPGEYFRFGEKFLESEQF